MDSSIIIILAIILLILIALNNITVVANQSIQQAGCSQTAFGCCPDGVNSKVNFYGTNCPGYRLQPGYFPPPQPIPGPQPQPIPPPQPIPGPGPGPGPIGGCAGTRYGCCLNNYTPKVNQQGSNCILK
jgi:hypothetical protein